MKKLMTLALTLILGISMIGCSSKSVATVNGEGIPLEYYKTYVNWVRIINYGDEQAEASSIWETEMEDGTTSSSSEDNKSSEKKTYWDSFKESVLQQMEQSEVIYQKAKELNILPTDEEVQESIDRFNEYIKSDETTKEQAEKAGINDEFLKYVLTRDLAGSAYQKYFFDNIKADESKLKKEYESNKDGYNTITTSHILISTIDDSGKELSDEKKAEAKAKAEEVLKKAKAGENFAKLAQKYSEDEYTAQYGGDLGNLTYSQMENMEKAFKKAAFALNKGEISEIVETSYGYHIIKVVDKANTYEEVKESVKQAVYSPDYEKEKQDLINNVKIEVNEKELKSVSYK